MTERKGTKPKPWRSSECFIVIVKISLDLETENLALLLISDLQ